MLTQHRIPGVDLNRLAHELAEVEAHHQPVIPLREDMRHVPTGCRCGIEFSGDDPWRASREHILKTRALAALEALHRPCPTCDGTGVTGQGFRARGSVCVDCAGSGWTPTPLPPFQFRDSSGAVWRVDMSEKSFVTHRAFVSPVDS